MFVWRTAFGMGMDSSVPVCVTRFAAELVHNGTGGQWGACCGLCYIQHKQTGVEIRDQHNPTGQVCIDPPCAVKFCGITCGKGVVVTGFLDIVHIRNIKHTQATCVICFEQKVATSFEVMIDGCVAVCERA